jgi:hypothetical protein
MGFKSSLTPAIFFKSFTKINNVLLRYVKI